MAINRATLEINVSALRHNVARLRSISQSRLMAVVKANAYGHGGLAIACFLSPLVDGFAVARIEEAIALREAGISSPILLLEGTFSCEALHDVCRYDLSIVVHQQAQIEALKTLNNGDHPITVWLKIDTGMHRLGFSAEAAEQAFFELVALPCVAKPIHLLSHFANADQLDDLSYSHHQMAQFDHFFETIAAKSDQIGWRSLSATAGIFSLPNAHYELIRPGLSLYGISPFHATHQGVAFGQQLGLRPVMRLVAPLIAIRAHAQGEPVGYGSTWRSERATYLGVVALGYGDGYPRSINAGTPVLINGRQVPIVGRVSMDMIVVDLGETVQDRLGDEVVFWGGALPIEQIATHNEMSVYELITRVTDRPTLRYITDEGEQISPHLQHGEASA